MGRRADVVLALLAATLLAGCATEHAGSAGDEAAPLPGATAEPTAGRVTPSSPSAESAAGDERPLAPPTPEVGGLPVRHLDADGTIRTIRVEDFPR